MRGKGSRRDRKRVEERFAVERERERLVLCDWLSRDCERSTVQGTFGMEMMCSSLMTVSLLLTSTLFSVVYSFILLGYISHQRKCIQNERETHRQPSFSANELISIRQLLPISLHKTISRLHIYACNYREELFWMQYRLKVSGSCKRKREGPKGQQRQQEFSLFLSQLHVCIQFVN